MKDLQSDAFALAQNVVRLTVLIRDIERAAKLACEIADDPEAENIDPYVSARWLLREIAATESELRK